MSLQLAACCLLRSRAAALRAASSKLRASWRETITDDDRKKLFARSVREVGEA